MTAGAIGVAGATMTGATMAGATMAGATMAGAGIARMPHGAEAMVGMVMGKGRAKTSPWRLCQKKARMRMRLRQQYGRK